jgi:hypothetical protein
MNAKRLETILAGEFATGESEMVQRFQKLRDHGLLPVSRGRNAERISRDHVVSGLLSVVSHRPGNAGVTARTLRGLVPVGGPNAGFAGASTLAQALRLALGDTAALESIVGLRLKDGDAQGSAGARAAIFFLRRETPAVTYYVHSDTYAAGRRAGLQSDGPAHIDFPGNRDRPPTVAADRRRTRRDR